MKLRSIAILLCASFLSFRGMAQKDSVYAVYQLLPSTNILDTLELDLTHPSMVHRYDSLSFQLPIGNFGGPNIRLSWQPFLYTGFQSVMLRNELDDSLVYFHSSGPFTEIRYVLGLKAEQNLLLTHFQPISRNASITARYHKINTQGFYKQQRIDSDRLTLSFRVQQPEKKYSIYGGVIYNRSQREDNGGIQSDSDFVEIGIGNKELLQVNFQDVSLNRAMLRAAIHQKLALSKSIWLYHYGEFLQSIRTHYDADINPVFYPDTLFNGRETFSKVELNKGSNLAGLGFRYIYGSLIAGYCNEVGTFVLTNQRTFFQNHGAHLNGTLHQGHHKLNVQGNFWFSGYNAADFRAQVLYGYAADTSAWRFFARLYAQSRQPTFDELQFRSNVVEWSNDWNKLSTSEAVSAVENMQTRSSFSLAYRNTEGLIYFDTTAMPAQTEQFIHQIKLMASQQFRKGHFHALVNAVYQPVLGSDRVRMPEIVLNGRLWFDVRIFKGKMNSLIGLEGFWFSKWQAYAYEVSTDQFHLQEANRVGGFPHIDAFLNARVSQAEFFIKATNLTSFILTNNYYGAYRYPLADFSVKLGIRWQFYN